MPIPTDNLWYAPISTLSEHIRARDISPVELTETALRRIEALNPVVNAFISVQADSALKDAAKAEREIARGDVRGPLHGIPIGIKDLFDTKGVITTGGTRAFPTSAAISDAAVTARLRSAGAILVGKLHLDELAYGPAGTNDHFGPARNPWDLQHMSGGSSSGAAVALATGLVFGAVGTDTGGSIRIPSALCGVTGLKPTFGLIDLDGAVALAWSMDTAGPMARSVGDCATLLRILSTDGSVGKVQPAKQRPQRALSGVRLGIPVDAPFTEADSEVRQAVDRAIEVLETLGARTERVRIPLLPAAFAISTVILMAEASAAHLALLKERAEGLGLRVRRRLEAGLAIPAATYLHAQRLRRELKAQVRSAMWHVDVLVTPTVPVCAPELEAERVKVGDEEDDVRRALPRFTRPFNLTGQPALALPCGFSPSGTPLSLQLVGRWYEDEAVLRIGQAYQEATRWHDARPNLPPTTRTVPADTLRPAESEVSSELCERA
jgi:aspartyl-tRNA(Asn)/glutamyl-tRNA(Gln) amidotransferase subunit A